MILGGSLPAEAVHAIRRHDPVPCIRFVIQSAKIGNRNMRRDWRDQLHQTRSHKFGNFGVRISREPFGMSTLNAACQPDPHTHTHTHSPHTTNIPDQNQKLAVNSSRPPASRLSGHPPHIEQVTSGMASGSKKAGAALGMRRTEAAAHRGSNNRVMSTLRMGLDEARLSQGILAQGN